MLPDLLPGCCHKWIEHAASATEASINIGKLEVEAHGRAKWYMSEERDSSVTVQFTAGRVYLLSAVQSSLLPLHHSIQSSLCRHVAEGRSGHLVGFCWWQREAMQDTKVLPNHSRKFYLAAPPGSGSFPRQHLRIFKYSYSPKDQKVVWK